MKGQVLHRERVHLKVPDWSLISNELLTKKVAYVFEAFTRNKWGLRKDSTSL